MPVDNIHTLKGTLYAKETRKVPNKKKPMEPDWEFNSIKVETKIQVGGRTITYIPELALDKGVNWEGFEVGDQIEVDYYLTGKAISPTWYKTEAKANYIKFADIQTGNPNRVKANTNTTIPEDDKVFTVPNPNESNSNNDDDLPF